VIFVAVAVVVAVAGAGWPVVAEKVDWAAADPLVDALDFFFLGLGCDIVSVAGQKLGETEETHVMPGPDRLEAFDDRDILPQVGE